ncbi:AhpC/TSA family protein [Sphingobacterium faecium]|nr:AhpC/TSA family protein [Sphingobacterium faecium]
MIKNIIYFLCMCMCMAWNAHAQNKHETKFSQRLHVGDKVPQLNHSQVLFKSAKDIQLHSNDQVVLLDFFDTFCTACIASLPKLQKLQDELKENLQIVMVTWQDKATIEKFWKSNAFIRENKIQLPVIYGDTLLRQFFPHMGVPHVAWLFRGYVQAVTFSEFINRDNILKLSNEGSIALPLKWDFDDVTFIKDIETKNLLGEVKLTGFQDGRPTQSYKHELDSVSGLYRTSIINQSILGAYMTVWSQIKKPTFILRPDRIEWLVVDSSRFDYEVSSQTSNVWLAKHGICYERLDKHPRNPIEQARLVLCDLDRFLNIKVYWAKKMRKVWALKGTFHKADKMVTGNKISSSDFLAFGIDMQNKYPIVIDLVNVKESFVLPKYKNLQELNKGLSNYGLQIVEEQREIDVLVFEEVK